MPTSIGLQTQGDILMKSNDATASTKNVHEQDYIERINITDAMFDSAALRTTREAARHVMMLGKNGKPLKRIRAKLTSLEATVIKSTNLKVLLNSFTKSGKPVTDLSRFARLIYALDCPHRHLKFVHVAGTNGKGSVCQYITQSLLGSGKYKNVGKFTSPHLLSPEERIEVDDAYISEIELTLMAGVVLYAIIEHHIEGVSQFELYTAAAFLYFTRRRCDIVVLECGIGGLLDCTNIITPLVSVITSVGLDHTDILGRTLREIAVQKCGIIKPRVPVCIGNMPKEAYDIVHRTASENSSQLYPPPVIKIKQTSLFGSEFTVKGFNRTFKTSMGGKHQVRNDACAIRVLSLLGLDSGEINLGIEETHLTARCQIIENNPLTIVDGAHNEDGFAALTDMLYAIPMEFVFVVGCTDKHSPSYLFKNIRFGDKVILTDGFAENAVPSGELAKQCHLYGISQSCIFTAGTTEKALTIASELVVAAREAYHVGSVMFPDVVNHPSVHRDAAIAVTGSLYLAGDLFRLIFEE